jgi:7-alpha-hydroxysteroid dehydrogenase
MILDRFQLGGKVAIVTGASAGIGRGTAVGLAEAGASVVVAARTASKLDEAAAEVRAAGGRALAVVTDVNDKAQLDALVEKTLAEFGRIDILVNNAGGTGPTPALFLDMDDFAAAFHFNVGTALYLSKLCAPHMVTAGGGSIVNISSAMSYMVEPGFVAYGSAKAALSHMTRLLACEWAPQIRVNALAVGATETEALGMFLNAAPNVRDEMIAMTPMGRLGTPEDIALGVLYLASSAGSWITGKIFEIDGGTVASNWPMKMPSGL